MSIKGDLNTKGYSVSAVNDLPNLDLPRWGYFKKTDGRIVYLPADPVSLRRSRNKGYIFLGDTKPDVS